MSNHQRILEPFQITRGGPLYNFLSWLGLEDKPGKLVLTVFCVAWLPSAILSAIEGTFFSGSDLPFIKDVSMQARLLIALPMLILIKFPIDRKVSAVAAYIHESLINREDQLVVLKKALQKTIKLTHSAIVEAILFVLVIATTISFVKAGVFIGLEGNATSWITTGHAGDESLSYAGYWLFTVSIPFMQFFLIRWFWRYFVWSLFLYRMSKANLNLMPTHPDRSGGLGVILLAQKSFALIFVCGSVIISGQFIAMLLQQPDTFLTLRNEAAAYIIFSIILILLPMLFFLGKLQELKNQGLLDLSKLGVKMSREFEKEWINPTSEKKEIEEKLVDPSMVFDYGGMYDSLQQLRIVPVTLQDLVGLAVLLLIPFLPSLFIHYSVAELLQKLAGLLM
jgi:hypothetical protein